MKGLVILQPLNSSIIIKPDITSIGAIFTEHIAAICTHKNVIVVEQLSFPHDAIFFFGFIVERLRESDDIIPSLRYLLNQIFIVKQGVSFNRLWISIQLAIIRCCIDGRFDHGGPSSLLKNIIRQQQTCSYSIA
ncbi:hypothetical protein D3C73_1258880 [compost metagenome]